MMKKFTGAIFDLDGTLLDSMWVWEQIDVDFLSRRGIDLPEDYLKKITPMGFEAAARYTIDRFGLQEQPRDLIGEWYAMAEDYYKTKVGLKPHAKEFLRCLADQGVRIGAATSSDSRLLSRLCVTITSGTILPA